MPATFCASTAILSPLNEHTGYKSYEDHFDDEEEVPIPIALRAVTAECVHGSECAQKLIPQVCGAMLPKILTVSADSRCIDFSCD